MTSTSVVAVRSSPRAPRRIGLALLVLALAAPALAAAPLAISPTSATVTAGGQATFSASGGAGGYRYALSSSGSGGHVDETTGAYTAGGSAGVDVVTVTDADGATKNATVRVLAAKGATPDLGGPRL